MRFGFLLVLATMLLATPAAAQTRWAQAQAEAPRPSNERTADAAPAPEATDTLWYGWQTLAVDTASIATATGGALSDHALPLAAVGLGGYLLAAPLVHLSHGNALKAGASLGIHAFGGIVSTAVALGFFQASCHDVYTAHDLEETRCSGTAFALPLLIGVGVSSALDAIFLGHENVVRKPVPSISANLGPIRGGATAGLSGTF